MNSLNFRVRRATLDDISPLTAMWNAMHYPIEELSRRITEFQVAEDKDGKVLGGVGLQISERQGQVHSEAFADFALADHLRPLLWDRIQSVATNHGLLRLWTRENAPFWNHCGLVKPDSDALAKLPAVWRDESAVWLTLKLKEDLDVLVSLDKEFSAFMQAEKQRSLRTIQHARILKGLATFVALVVFLLVLAGAFVLVRRNPHLLGR